MPHELRPVAVLHKTMTFLLSQVADLGRDGHWENWFDYLWNRTRGIRKVGHSVLLTCVLKVVLL